MILFDQAVTTNNLQGQCPPSLGEGHPLVFLVIEQTSLGQALRHIGDRRRFHIQCFSQGVGRYPQIALL